MKLTPYKQLLAMGKDAVRATLAVPRAFAAKKQAELEMAKLDERIATLENEINERSSADNINFGSIIDLLDDIALAERRKAQFAKIIEEMFPTE